MNFNEDTISIDLKTLMLDVAPIINNLCDFVELNNYKQTESSMAMALYIAFLFHKLGKNKQFFLNCVEQTWNIMEAYEKIAQEGDTIDEL